MIGIWLMSSSLKNRRFKNAPEKSQKRKQNDLRSQSSLRAARMTKFSSSAKPIPFNGRPLKKENQK